MPNSQICYQREARREVGREEPLSSVTVIASKQANSDGQWLMSGLHNLAICFLQPNVMRILNNQNYHF